MDIMSIIKRVVALALAALIAIYGLRFSAKAANAAGV